MTASEDRASAPRVVVTGMGVIAGRARGLSAFAAVLRRGRGDFDVLRDDPRSRAIPVAALDDTPFEKALAQHARSPYADRALRMGRRAPRTVQVALLAALEAVADARLDLAGDDLGRCGVIVGGQNINQRYGHEQAERYREAPEYVSPSYAMQFLDTDHVAVVSEVVGARGEGMSVGGASASGNVAIIQALRLLRARHADVCLVVGAMTDLSPVELKALDSSGALAGDRFGDEPALASRPFDREREGFVYGQSCACLILEAHEHAEARGAASIWGEVLGGSIVLDAHRSTEPSADGEARAMINALKDARVSREDVQYLNAHGTSSRVGDPVELEAIAAVFGEHRLRFYVNSTKGLVGHGISSAGAVEAVATLIQLTEGFVHANANLSDPLRDDVRLAPAQVSASDARVAMSNSFGFGGINTSIVLAKYGARDDGSAPVR